MKKFNYPTTIYFGEGCIKTFAREFTSTIGKRPLVVTDQSLVKLGIVEKIVKRFEDAGTSCSVFSQVDPNPIEKNVLDGAQACVDNQCDSIIAIGGGSPMDAAKVIAIKALHSEPLEVFDDAKNGSDKIIHPLPPIVAIPTTAGTGSEVGRCGVVTVNKTKLIFFHPTLLPKVALLEPELTAGLPPHLTAQTGIDAFTHCLEAYLAPGFDPMADGIALEGMRLIAHNLPKVFVDGGDLEARGHMQLAATMGATAFQKGLGMIHSLAHPLSAISHLHHGLANALVGPACLAWIESKNLNDDQKRRIENVKKVLAEIGYRETTVAQSLTSFYTSLGVHFGLKNHNVQENDLPQISIDAFQDVCHQTNMLPVREADLKNVLNGAFE